MAYCLIKPLADAFKKAIKEGRIDPQKLADMSSEERRAFFEGIVGSDNAPHVNALFEQKSLMKNMEQGMISWAKEVTGIKPNVRSSLIDRIAKMDERILNPADQKVFLEDLAAKRLGTDVTLEEAQKITELSQELSKAKETYQQDPVAYGIARVRMENFLNDIKRENAKVTLEQFKTAPLGAIKGTVENIASLTKSLKASLDLSAFLRQGGKVAINDPIIWVKNVTKTFKDVYETLKKKTTDEGVMDAIKSEIYSRPLAFDGTFSKMKLAIGTGEEAFPSKLQERVPGLGRAFKASDIAYEGFLMRLRADLAEEYYKQAEKAGVDVKNTKQLEAIGQLVNSITGRGDWGTNSSKMINSAFFSPKNLKANIDFMTAHVLDSKSTPFVRKVAVKNLIRYAGVIAGISSIAKALWPSTSEQDARSSDFLKIRIGDTRFDYSGGIGSIITLLARLKTFESKSSSTGAITTLGTGFGQKSPGALIGDFLMNKLSPIASTGKDILYREDRSGKPITVGGELSNLFMPLPVTNYLELKNNPHAAPMLLSLIADSLGIATNTYGDTTQIGERFVEKPEVAKSIHDLSNAVGKPVSFEDWNSSKSPDITQFKATHSADDWNNALARYDYQIKTMVDEALASPKFKAFSPEDKVKYINQIDTDAKNKVFSQFGFKQSKVKSIPKKKLKI